MDTESQIQDKIRTELFGAPRQASAGFYWHAVKDEDASKSAGYPVYRDVEYVLVVLRGGKEAKAEDFSYRVTDEHREAFKEAYAVFKQRDAQRLTPLTIIPDYMPSLGATLADLDIKSVEALATATVPAPLDAAKAWAKRYVAFRAGIKPRLRLVDGALQEVA